MADTDERVVVPFEEAVAMLPDGDDIHTFRSSPMCLIGADWRREQIIEAIRDGGVELAGPTATSMGHGLVLCNDRTLFIATKKATP